MMVNLCYRIAMNVHPIAIAAQLAAMIFSRAVLRSFTVWSGAQQRLEADFFFAVLDKHSTIRKRQGWVRR